MRKRLCPSSRNTSEGVCRVPRSKFDRTAANAAACEYRSGVHHLSVLRLPGPHSAAKLHEACITKVRLKVHCKIALMRTRTAMDR